jgi:hypothetical protein
MTLNPRQREMLTAIRVEPRTFRYFSHGWQQVAPKVTETYLADMVKEELLYILNGVYFLTAEGERVLSSLESAPVVPSRSYCNAQMTGTYQSPKWNVREGADQHLNFKSRGQSV